MSSEDVTWNVLVVEDHEPTARLIVTAFGELDSPISTHVVQDGSECLSVLRNEDDSMPEPDIVLLDLDLQEIHGFDVLEARLENPSFLQIPTIVFSGKEDMASVRRCYDRGANTFIRKPEDLDGYLAITKTIADYWFSIGELPEEATNPKS